MYNISVLLIKKIDTMKSCELIALLKQDGWYFVAANGSHHNFKHPTKKGKIKRENNRATPQRPYTDWHAEQCIKTSRIEIKRKLLCCIRLQ